MLETIICFLFPSIIDSIYEEGYLDGAHDTSQLVREYHSGNKIMDDIIKNLPED